MRRNGAGIITFITGLRADIYVFKMDRKSGGMIKAFPVLDLKMQMRFRAVAGITAAGNRLSPSDALSFFYLNAARHQMRKQGIFLPAVSGRGLRVVQVRMTKQHIISTDIPDQGIGFSAEDFAVLTVCTNFFHHTVCGRKHRSAIAVIAVTVGEIPPAAFSGIIQNEKIICISLGIDVPGVRSFPAHPAVDNGPGSFERQGIGNLR